MTQATQAGPELVREFAPEGVLRAGINLGNPVIAQGGAKGGEPQGVGPALARELARGLGLDVRFVPYETAGRLADGVRRNEWDVGFLAIDPERAEVIDFSPPYVHIEGTYLVPDASALRTVSDADRAGARIAVGLKTAYDLHLTRQLRHAELVRAPSSPAALELFLRERLDAVAGVRQPLAAAARARPGLRVMDDSFMVIRQASGVPKGRPAAHRYLAAFIEKAKRSGFVMRALEESGVVGAAVAPLALIARRRPLPRPARRRGARRAIPRRAAARSPRPRAPSARRDRRSRPGASRRRPRRSRAR